MVGWTALIETPVGRRMSDRSWPVGSCRALKLAL